jgi:preprotein translocase subunit SecF
MDDIWIIIGCFGFIGVIFTVAIIGAILDPYREVIICTAINSTIKCFKTYEAIKP